MFYFNVSYVHTSVNKQIKVGIVAVRDLISTVIYFENRQENCQFMFDRLRSYNYPNFKFRPGFVRVDFGTRSYFDSAVLKDKSITVRKSIERSI